MKEVRIKPCGVIYNRLAACYDDNYSNYCNELIAVLSEKEFHDAIANLNDTITSYWPCVPAITIG
jgi:hypothetical protein